MKTKFEVKDFRPVDGNVIVQPGQEIKIKTLMPEPMNYSDTVLKKNMETDKVQRIVKKYTKEPTIIKVGQILALPDNMRNDDKSQYREGDWVIYRDGGSKLKLDLLASKSDDRTCPIIMKHYEIISKINMDE